MDYLFPPAPQPSIPVVGETQVFPVHRIFCVGRNYVAHAQEMGGEVDREAPWYFTKSAHAVCHSGTTIPYPPGTTNLHYEVELAVALGAAVFEGDLSTAQNAIYGYGCALDMTRRDRQQDGKDHRRPWDLGKDIENGAVLTPLTRAGDVGDLSGRRIQLLVNGALKQDAVLDDMVWSVPEIISHLSRYYHLQAGDLILTGTPAGVGPVVAGDHLTAQIDGLSALSLTLSSA
jgi:fumarylpyruvate hydrolase